MNYNRKYRNVEIYFVLYLAALVLLIPASDNDKPATADEYGTLVYTAPFSLIADKNVMICRFNSDSAGIKITYLDSVNIIRYSGDVGEVHFEFVVEDTASRKKITLGSESGDFETKGFRMLENPEKRAVSFFWNPEIPDLSDRAYIVHVSAFANVKTTGSDSRESLGTFKVKYRFTLNFINETNSLASSGTITALPPVNNTAVSGFSQENTYPFLSGTVSLIPQNPSLKAIAFQPWSNTIFASNINLIRDISSKPALSIQHKPADNGGDAEITTVSDDRIVIKGKTPSYGKIIINVRITSKGNGNEYTCSFTVSPQFIEEPDYDRIMYPKITYTIDPKLPLKNFESKAYLKDGNNILAVSPQGAPFKFTPDYSDINKVFVLERYLDSTMLGQVYKISIRDFPQPEITDIQYQKTNEVLVITRSYGLTGEAGNEVSSFDVEGNAKYVDLRGYLKEYDRWLVQSFLFTPSNPGEPFQFRIKAIDKRGKISQEKVFRK